MKQKKVYIIVAILIIAALAYLFFFTGNKATAPVTTDETSNTVIGENTEHPENVNGAAQSPLAATKNTLAISTQESGSQITIDNYYLEKPGYIVIHEIKNDSPGTVVGTSGLLKAGAGQDLTFQATLKPNTTYFALLYEDNGDKKFNLASDKLLPLFSSTSGSYSDKQAVQFSVEE